MNANDDRIGEVIEDLLRVTAASRVTIRQDRPPSVYPVTHEATAPGVISIRGVETPDMENQPVAVRVLKGEQVVQDDCVTASQEPHFQEMLDIYGGMRAQIVTPIEDANGLRGILSLHQLGHTRTWSTDDAQRCREAAAELASLL